MGIFSSPGRTDQGVDYAGSGPIPALDRAVVTSVGSTRGDVQGLLDHYVIYKLLGGPYRGNYVYVAENFQPSVHVGQQLKAGQSVGTAPGKYPYIEVGFNSTAKGWEPLAPLNKSNPGAPTKAGQVMARYIPQSAGVHAAGGKGGAGGGGSSFLDSIPLPGGIGSVGDLTGAAGSTVSTVGGDALGLIPGYNSFKSAADAFSFLFSIRGLQVIGGGIIMLMGLYLLARQVGLGGIADSTPGPVKDAALAAVPEAAALKVGAARSTVSSRADRTRRYSGSSKPAPRRSTAKNVYYLDTPPAERARRRASASDYDPATSDIPF